MWTSFARKFRRDLHGWDFDKVFTWKILAKGKKKAYANTMKTVFWLLLAALLILAWQNPDKVRSYTGVASKWIGEQSRWVADKWDPVDKAEGEGNESGGAGTSSTNDVVLQELPEGMFVLLQDVMISTKTDTVRWRAGTSVRKLGEGAGKILVSDGVNQTTVDQSILTRDLQQRKALYRRLQEVTAGQAKQQALELERELAAVESKILSLQNEKRQLAIQLKENNGRQRPMTTEQDFLDLAIKTQEQRRLEIYKQLGRSTPQMLIAR
ncbi:hypothetical protein [Roseimicrobium sp. ORNL1]|uniref:hypothetical protein n=1 Tax=Roseimicrobium sp. ORNL1 TaxID=2711231 RepID=UPI0013E20875|nr:hypothetical protein [Roseimicrobium sp. ORNL1]QIF04811.1 hypothetical protein G5S37_25945 [Roseimicrobium sp. ORNL1]